MKNVMKSFLVLGCVTQLNASAFILQDGISLPVQVAKTKAGLLDSTFGTGGKVTTNIGGSSDVARAVALQPDGKIVVVGNTTSSGTDDFVVARYNSNGSLDTSFGTGGKTITPIGIINDLAQGVGLQSDGKIIVAGYSYILSVADFIVVRYKSDGVIDTTFGENGTGIVRTSFDGNHSVPWTMIVQPDDKIVLAGFSDTGGIGDFALARYTANGSLDTATFGSGTGKVKHAVGSATDYIYGIALQTDGKIVVAGYSYNGTNNDFALVRYNADGSLDTTTFGSGTGKVTTNISGNDVAGAVLIQPDGKIIVAGYSSGDFALVRYNADGSLDTTTFGAGTGKVTTAVGAGTDEGYAAALQADGKILVAGYSSNGSNNDFALVRYNADGSLDDTFGSAGKVVTNFASQADQILGVVLQKDGKVVAAGYANSSGNTDFALARYTNNIDPLTQSASLFADGRGGLLR